MSVCIRETIHNIVMSAFHPIVNNSYIHDISDNTSRSLVSGHPGECVPGSVRLRSGHPGECVPGSVRLRSGHPGDMFRGPGVWCQATRENVSRGPGV